MRALRQGRPDLMTLAVSAMASALLCALGLTLAALALQRLLALPVWFLPQVLGGFALVLLAAAADLPRHLPRRRFGAANQVTLVRASLVALLIGFLGPAGSSTGAAWWMVAIALLGLILDGLDGWLARRGGLQSAFGARFDMETDAALVMVLCLLVWQRDQAGAWVLLSGAMRYLFVAAGALLPWVAAPLPPSRRRQSVCVLQTAALILCLVPVVGPLAGHAIAGLALGVLTWSFAVDTLWLARNRACKEE